MEMPDNWKTDKMAGKDWLQGFLKRNKELSIRKPQATSLSRAASFNKFNVNNFFNLLSLVIEKFNILPSSIGNMDETGVYGCLFLAFSFIILYDLAFATTSPSCNDNRPLYGADCREKWWPYFLPL